MYQNNFSSGVAISSSYFATHFLPVADNRPLYSLIRRYMGNLSICSCGLAQPAARSYLGGYSCADYLLKLLQLKAPHLRRFLTP